MSNILCVCVCVHVSVCVCVCTHVGVCTVHIRGQQTLESTIEKSVFSGQGVGPPGQDVDDVIELAGSVLLVKRDTQGLPLRLGNPAGHHVTHDLSRP